MKRKILMLVLLLSSFSTLFAITSKNDWKNLGTSKNLSGKTYVLMVFCSYPGTQWVQQEVNQLINEVYSATGWLTKAAAEYGVKAEFEIYSLGLNGDPITLAAPFGTMTIIDDAMRAAGYPAGYNFEEYAKQTTGCDNCLVLVCSNQSGRCYSITHTKELSDWNKKYMGNDYKLEGCVIYKNSIYDGSFVWASTIAHEILHTYGAWDLYDVYGTYGQKKNNLIELYFKDSIMHRIDSNIENLEIDSLNAYMTGLTDVYETWYDQFQTY